jgi:aspartyl-tRNA synthetase
MGYQIARRLIDVANAGDIEAIKEILNRIDGKVAEKHEMTGSLPIQIIFRPVEVKADSISIEGEAKELPLPTEELNAQVA